MGERGWNERNLCVDPSAYLPSTIIHFCTSNTFLHDLTDISLHILWYSFHDVRSFATVCKVMRRFTISLLSAMDAWDCAQLYGASSSSSSIAEYPFAALYFTFPQTASLQRGELSVLGLVVETGECYTDTT